MCVEGTKKFAKSRLRRKFWGLIWQAVTGVATLTISVDFFSACRKCYVSQRHVKA